MSQLLWILAILLVLVGGVWMAVNRWNKLCLGSDVTAYQTALHSAGNEAMHALRSMQLTDARIALESNARNWYISRIVFGLGILLLVLKFTGVL